MGLIALGLPLLVAGPASAHTPALTANCGGVTVTGSYYESWNTNTLGVRIDGGPWTTKTFAVTDSLTVPVPQDGLVHTYAAYVHTTNPNTAYSHDYSGTVGPCGNKHVTAVLWSKTDPTCAADGALVPQTEPTGITVNRNPASGTGPGHYVLTFIAQSGYTIDGPTSQTLDVLPKLSGDVCATEVQPVDPTITNPACTGPGSSTPGSITLPADGGGISYSKAGNVVTATADGAHKFVTLPSGWSLVDSHHATYTVTYDVPSDYPDCLVPVTVPVPPSGSAPTCDTDGELVVTPSDHVVTRVDGVIVEQETSFGPGKHALSYEPADGYIFDGDAQTSFTIGVQPATQDCPATPVNPTVTQSVCNGPGTHTEPLVVLGDVPGDHVGYVYDDVTHVVTATPDAGFALADLPDGWVGQEDGTATFQVELVDPGPCLVEVAVPTPPVAGGPTCSADGALIVVPTDHVITTVDGGVVEKQSSFGPGKHVLSYQPAQGYTFGEEVQTEFSIGVLPATNDCPSVVVQPPTTSGTTVSGPHHPTVLPNTGAPRSLALLATGGLVLALAGAGLLALRRRA